ncbi:TVP38/TMEM64 family protein [Oscillibacter sp. MSJ-2]|uniref:TVP38/TMEM64 family membrane protein n=1 Tax=Dysosmobacter acutus TaxID=2841504 RepID=A0ABS6FA76_9FIRM|nr:TVP38/TMEM64 family protein [Dysosmobacter acutus]MBU5626960.1 TVP38/TMEM64 family protein [Dysosmobacter acutus]
MNSSNKSVQSNGIQAALQLLSIAGFCLCVVLAIWGWRARLLTSPEAMAAFVGKAGVAGILLFVAFQIVQVVLPILPGGLGCLAGVLLFGGLHGFFYNYIGICVGSLLAFAIARCCGRPLLYRLFSPSLIQRYSSWTDRHFAKWFALAIFLPVAPDDFLCYLAGTTRMSWTQFALIILLGKPAAIALYSLGLAAIWTQVIAYLT